MWLSRITGDLSLYYLFGVPLVSDVEILLFDHVPRPGWRLHFCGCRISRCFLLPDHSMVRSMLTVADE